MKEQVILTAEKMDKLLEQAADDITSSGTGDLLLIGILRRGANLANRISQKLESNGIKIPSYTLDINLYRDDWTTFTDGIPRIGKSAIPADITGKRVILIDDVLFTGRTIRSALEALLDYGRPAKVELFVLIDRGHRELPICADYIGMALTTTRDQRVDVELVERDGRDCVIIRS